MSACIITRCRNERNICEWVSYYLKLGFEHIFIYDDMSTIPVSEVVYPKFSTNVCTVLRPARRKNILNGAYSTLMTSAKSRNYTYILDVDLDEYLYTGQHKTIQELIAYYQPFDMLQFNFLSFGSSGIKHYNGNECIPIFTQCSKTLDTWGKAMARTDKITKKIHPHLFIVKPGSIVKNVENQRIKPSNSIMNKQLQVPVIPGTNIVDGNRLQVCVFHYATQDINTFINRKVALTTIFKDTPQLRRLLPHDYAIMDNTMRQMFISILSGETNPKNSDERNVLSLYEKFNHNDLINTVLKKRWENEHENKFRQ